MDKNNSLTRRALLGTLGAAAGTAAFASTAFAQGGCRDGYGQAPNSRCPLSMEAATAPIKEVFDSTGWKTTRSRASPSMWWTTKKKLPSISR